MLPLTRPRESAGTCFVITANSRATPGGPATIKGVEKKGKGPGKGNTRARRKPIIQMEEEMIVEKMM
jgi:hypothetical protein